MLRDSGTTRQGWLITMIEQPTLFDDKRRRKKDPACFRFEARSNND